MKRLPENTECAEMRHGGVIITMTSPGNMELFVFYPSHRLGCVSEKEISHMGKNNRNLDLVCEKTWFWCIPTTNVQTNQQLYYLLSGKKINLTCVRQDFASLVSPCSWPGWLEYQLAGYKNISVLCLSCRTSDSHALVLWKCMQQRMYYRTSALGKITSPF